MSSRIKSFYNEAVMGLLFGSLLVIYLSVPTNSLVTFLCVVTLAIGMVVTLDSDWNELNMLALFAALTSVVAAYILGRTLSFGSVVGILLPILWVCVLYLLYERVWRHPIVVPDDRVVLRRDPYSGDVEIAPLSLPTGEHVVATMPLYRLHAPLSITKINTKPGHDVEAIHVQIFFKIATRHDAIKVLDSYANRHQAQKKLAGELGKDLDDVRRDLAFWERLLIELIQDIAAKVVREVVFASEQRAVDIYKDRGSLQMKATDKLEERMRPWGITILQFEIERVEVDGDRFKNADPEGVITRDTRMERIKAEREAERVRLVLETEVDIEARRVRAISAALREAGLEVTPEAVFKAIRASSEWMLEGDYTLLPRPEPAAVAAKSASGSDGGKKG